MYVLGAESTARDCYLQRKVLFRRTTFMAAARARLARSQAQILQPAMLNARGIVTQYRKLLRVHTKLICRYAQDLRKRTPLAR